MNRPLGVGIIGTGVGLRTLLPGFRRTGRAEVVALCGSSQSRVEEVAQRFNIPLLTSDYRAVCESDQVDLICVASPNDLHVEHAIAALSTGKHVYLEKPTGIDLAGAHAINDAAQGQRRLVVVGHQLRFNPYIRAMRNLIRGGSVGRIYHLAIAQRGSGFTNPRRKWTWEFETDRGGGVRLAMGSHLVDLSGFLLGGEVQAIAATLDPVHRVRVPEGTESRECRVSNYFSAHVDFPMATAAVSSTAAAHTGPQFEIVAHGEMADLTFDLDRKLLLHRSGYDPEVVLDAETDSEYRHRQASSIFSTSFTYFADEIVHAIESEKTTLQDAATTADASRCMEALDAALHSYIAGSREHLVKWSREKYF
jgi:predicted dehydrogenase